MRTDVTCRHLKGENTPTHVGKTVVRRQVRIDHRKHPHACGEDMLVPCSSGAPLETPPRMWGRPILHVPLSLYLGNTPTHVGKTVRRWTLISARWKHPHACGEDCYRLTFLPAGLETPPRMWGRQRGFCEVVFHCGNTPTHVGKTTPISALGDSFGKHPHACGEDCSSLLSIALSRETPPRMWGRPAVPVHDGHEVGNTPTHVGKTDPDRSIMHGAQKHPHACGEDQRHSGGNSCGLETPPRMWGRQRPSQKIR